jgi:hypothetical protein
MDKSDLSNVSERLFHNFLMFLNSSNQVLAHRLKAAYFIIRICSDDLISLERESDGEGVGD